MAKKDFEFIFKFLLICAVFLSAWNYVFFSFPKITNATATSSAPFYDNFDSYEVGNLYGQGYWNFVGTGDPTKYKVRSDLGHWVSDFNALFNSQGGFIAGTSTNAVDTGSLVFFLDVLTTTVDSPSILFLQYDEHFEHQIVFQLWINQIDAGHYCVNFIENCDPPVYPLATSTADHGNFYKVGVSWDRSRQKIKVFNGSNWSSEYGPNIGVPWTSGIIGYGINQNYPWTFYIDNITDVNLEIPYYFSDPETWYSTHSRYPTSTAFFSDFIGIMAPIFERVTGFAIGIKDVFNTDEAYQTGYSFGAVLPAINGYIDKIDDFFGGFPLGTIFKWSIFVLVAIFIIRLVFKFIPGFG